MWTGDPLMTSGCTSPAGVSVPRRKAGKGIYPLGGDLWRIKVSAGPDLARSTPEKVVYRTVERRVRGSYRDAEEARARLLVEARQGRYGGTDATVNDLLDAWLRELERIGRAPSTLRGYRRTVDYHVRPTFGRLRVRDVTARQLSDFLAGLTEAGRAPATVVKVKAYLSSAFSQAMRWEWIDKDPTKLVRAPSIPNRRPLIPTVDEVVRVLRAAEESSTPEMGRAIWLAATTGVRRGELCALRVSDFRLDGDAGQVTVERALSAEEVWTTKNRRWRDIGLDALTVAVVRQQVAYLTARAQQAGTVLPVDAYLFSDHPRGEVPWKPDRVSRAFYRLTRQEGVVAHFHQLRKFMESHGLAAGFSVAEVAHQGGHDPAVLLRHYAGQTNTGGAISAVVAALLDGQR